MKRLLTLLFFSVFLTSALTVTAQTVFINKSDSKYHLLSCKYLDPSHDSIDMALAMKKGLSPCGVCKPTTKSASSSGGMGSMGAPKSMDAPKAMEKSGMGQPGNSSGNVAQKQCAVTDKDGKRCPGMAEEGSVYCWEHRDYKK
jgi:hypothetical protein